MPTPRLTVMLFSPSRSDCLLSE
uniref:Uncharacterized protein n=1 Tax=Arundo donax TaxID=35708 RepID=A0A0A8YW15_ARUDO